MRAASIARSLLMLALLLTVSTAEEPVIAISADSAGQPSAEEQQEIDKIRAALGPEFRIASKMFGDEIPVPASSDKKRAVESDLVDACSPASSFYLGTSPPSVERAIRFLSLAESDLKSLSTPAVVGSAAARKADDSAADAARLREAAQKCRELADQFEELAKLPPPKATQLR